MRRAGVGRGLLVLAAWLLVALPGLTKADGPTLSPPGNSPSLPPACVPDVNDPGQCVGNDGASPVQGAPEPPPCEGPTGESPDPAGCAPTGCHDAAPDDIVREACNMNPQQEVDNVVPNPSPPGPDPGPQEPPESPAPRPAPAQTPPRAPAPARPPANASPAQSLAEQSGDGLWAASGARVALRIHQELTPSRQLLGAALARPDAEPEPGPPDGPPSGAQAAVLEEALAPADWTLLASVARAAGAAFLAVAASWLWSLFSKIAPERALDHPTRSRILEFVRAEPGIPMNTVSRQFGLSWTNTLHHLWVLQRAGHVRVHRFGGRTGIFPTNAGYRGRETQVALLRRDTLAAIHRRLHESPGLDQRTLSALVHRSQPRVSQSLRRLADAGLVRGERQGRRIRYYPTPA